MIYTLVLILKSENHRRLVKSAQSWQKTTMNYRDLHRVSPLSLAIHLTHAPPPNHFGLGCFWRKFKLNHIGGFNSVTRQIKPLKTLKQNQTDRERFDYVQLNGLGLSSFPIRLLFFFILSLIRCICIIN